MVLAHKHRFIDDSYDDSCDELFLSNDVLSNDCLIIVLELCMCSRFTPLDGLNDFGCTASSGWLRDANDENSCIVIADDSSSFS